MIKNYLKIAWRNLIKNKASSSINIGGLAVGMAVTMLIGLWIWDELSFNKYHRNYNRIAQVMQKEKFLGDIRVWEHMPYKIGNLLKTSYGENFRHVITATLADDYSLSFNDKKISQHGIFIEDTAPEMFTLKMLRGNWNGLKDPHTILLSASAASSLFGSDDPMGKTIRINNTWDANNNMQVKVTGVYEDLPANTNFHDIQYFSSWDLYLAGHNSIRENSWDDHRLLIYAELQPGVSFEQAGANIRGSELKVIRSMDNMKHETAADPIILLNPMNRWHLYSDFKNGMAESGPVEFVWLVGIIGVFVLLLACINFINLSTARSEKRAKEVGIRKAIGSLRKQLVLQFFSESFLVVVLAFAAAIALAASSLSWFNNLAAKQIVMPWTNPAFWLICIIFILFTSILAGFYPAFYLSSFRPVKVLKGIFKAGRTAAIPRQALVVVQLCVSVTLIVCTIVVYKQVIFAQNRPIGYNRNGLLVVGMNSPEFSGKYDIIRNELKKTGVIAEMAESESPLTDISSNNGGFDWKGKTAGTEENFGTLAVTYEYGKTIGWQFIEGRDFSKTYGSDSSGFVINEAAARYMGMKHPVNEILHWKSKWLNMDKDFRIIGVIKDMVMQSPYESVKPTIFRLGGSNSNWIFIRVNPNISMRKALSKIEPVFKKLITSVPFEYRFASDEYAKKFATEQRIGKLATLFAGLAILISCMGLFGMASYMAEQRTKEIGVRKVLGATVLNLWALLSQEYVKLVLLSLLIALPLAYYFMHRWLQRYTYRTDLSWWVFAATAVGAIATTLLTVSYQSIKAALANPVKSLRSE